MLKLLAWAVPLDVTVRLIANQTVWYALGLAVGAGGVERVTASLSRAVGPWRGALLSCLAAAIAVAGAFALALDPGEGGLLDGAGSAALASRAWSLGAAPAAVAGTAAMVLLARLPGWHGGGLVAALGRNSMAVFVLHVLFLAGTRIVLVRSGLAVPLLLFPLLVTAGLAGPLVAARLLRGAGLARWLGI